MDLQNLGNQECPANNETGFLLTEPDPLNGTPNEVLPNDTTILPAQHQNDQEVDNLTNTFVQDSVEATPQYTYVVPVDVPYHYNKPTSAASLESPKYSVVVSINPQDRLNNPMSSSFEIPKYSDVLPINPQDRFINPISASFEIPKYTYVPPIDTQNCFINPISASLEIPNYSNVLPIDTQNCFINPISASFEIPNYSNVLPIDIQNRFNNTTSASFQSPDPEYSNWFLNDLQNCFNSPISESSEIQKSQFFNVSASLPFNTPYYTDLLSVDPQPYLVHAGATGKQNLLPNSVQSSEKGLNILEKSTGNNSSVKQLLDLEILEQKQYGPEQNDNTFLFTETLNEVLPTFEQILPAQHQSNEPASVPLEFLEYTNLVPIDTRLFFNSSPPLQKQNYTGFLGNSSDTEKKKLLPRTVKSNEDYLKFRKKNTENTRRSRERKRHNDQKMKDNLKDLEKEHSLLLRELEEAKNEQTELKSQLAMLEASFLF